MNIVGFVIRRTPDEPEEQSLIAITSSEKYAEYLKEHGYHFTCALAEYASSLMENANGKSHSWTSAQVKSTMLSLGLTIPDNVTNGDVTYLANMYYADLFPDPLKDENACFKAAYKVANDPDGYDGLIFNRWIADVNGKGISIDWEKFV